MSIKILIAENHRMISDGLVELIKGIPEVKVTALAADGVQAVELANEHNPDVVIMDINMPRLNGIEAARRISAGYTGVKIIALSAHSDKRYVKGMLAAGASAYILKDNAFDDLKKAIRTVMNGQRYFSQEIMEIVMDDYINSMETDENRSYASLSTREREVFQLLVEGYDTGKISDLINVSKRTVSTHRTNVMKKLKCDSIAAMTKIAIREGVILLDE